jgi:hypothetical protein
VTGNTSYPGTPCAEDTGGPAWSFIA